MANTVEDRIHFYYKGHTYEIEPASLSQDDAWFNATGLAHGASEEGTLLSQIYDSENIAIEWAQWNLIKTADEANSDGTITYWYVGVEDTNVSESVVDNPDGSVTTVYSSDKTYPDGTTVHFSYNSTINDDDTGNSLAVYEYPDGRRVETTTTYTLGAGDAIVEETTTVTTLSGGAVIDFPTESAGLKKGGGVTTSSVANNIYSYLANIDSAAENSLIYKQAKAITKLAPSASDGGGSKYLWLGGTDDSSNNWYWVGLDQYEHFVYTNLASEYRNWGAGATVTEPDNPGVQGGMAIALEQWPKATGSIGEEGEWNNLTQTDLLYSVIEWNGLIGTDAKDKLSSGSDDCVIHAGAEADQIKTSMGNDVIYGESGDDRISAGGGNDLILGGTGVDMIDAGSGDDIILAGEGSEEKVQKVKGGSGNDFFVLNSASIADAPSITDFDSGQDSLILDSTVFTAFENPDAADGEAGYFQVEANQYLRGYGLDAASNNETGVDDFLIFDIRSGKLYYDEDGNEGGSETVLIATLKGNAKYLDFDNFIVV